MPRENIVTKEIDWLKQPEYREVVTKKELLKDIKTNLISLLNDYKGRGIENEGMLIKEVNKMFTGGVVPSLVDWKILNVVLRELSEVKEQGLMYQNFIKDVSDSLGVTDLIKIRNFIEYITRLAPIEPIVEIEVDDFPKYTISKATASFDNNIKVPNETNRATIHWEVQEPVGTAYLRLTIKDIPSEDVEKYVITVQAGSFSKVYTLDGIKMGQKEEEKINIPINQKEWFGTRTGNLSFYVEVDAIDRRGNKSTYRETFIYPPSRGIPQGFSTFNVQYRPTEKRNWQATFGYKGDSFLGPERRSHGPVGLVEVDGNHKFRVRGYDPGSGWSDFLETPNYNLVFRGDPPGKPNPRAGNRTISRIDFNWKPTANTDYYTVYYREQGKGISRRWTIPTSSNPKSYFSGLPQNRGFTVYVRAHNKWYPNGILGTVWIRTRRRVSRNKTYYPTRHVRYNAQSYQPNGRAGYYRPRWAGGTRNASGVDRPHWKTSYSRWGGDFVQGHWREANWRLGKRSENYYVWRSGRSYRASDGQSHGNNVTFIEMNYRQMRNDLRGANVTKVVISFRRGNSTHGYPGKGRPVYLYNHNEEFSGSGSRRRPRNHLNVYDWNRRRISRGNNPALANNNFSRGGYADIANTRTRNMVRNIQDGRMKGFAFMRYYQNSFNGNVHRASTDYIRFHSGSFRVRVYYTVDV